MNSLVYNKLMMRLQNDDNVGVILSDPTLSSFDVNKAITQGPPIVRLKLLKHCVSHPRYRVHVDAFFEKESHHINFGETSLSWVDGFPQYASTIMSHVLKHLQPVHYKDFIMGCANRANEKDTNHNAYNYALLHDIFRLANWPKNTVSLVLNCFKNKGVEWKSVVALNIWFKAKTQNDQDMVLKFVQNMPLLHFSEMYGLTSIYDFATLVHTPLLEMFLNKLNLDDFKELVAALPSSWEPEQYEIFAHAIPDNLMFQQIFFEKITEFHTRTYIDDHLYAKMEKGWLEANLPTPTKTSSQRKM